MEDIFKDVEPMIYESRISVPYNWWAGDTAGKFFVALRDEKKILGTRCEQCGKVFVPPRKGCPQCFRSAVEWVDVSDSGALISYTVARRQLAALPKKAPLYFGLVKLDGADTGLLHFLDDITADDITIGMRVRARFAENRQGTINDIECFVPV